MTVKKIVRQNPRRVGRPATVEAERAIGIRLPAMLLESIDSWAKANGASRSEAIRRLVERSLAAEANVAKRRGGK
jgi:metal-responsive CopG/Arc/MetJ family transcriptional regulator